ncbi:MAG TPA: YdeI/OmpD-associated family protein [Candidatus Saccharimonadales bacterium]|nr:YdeI/OmpD-associated family protein [Candidatus Saccharimonadales bacterium]
MHAVLEKASKLPTIRFTATLFKIGEWTILRLPKDASAKLPSRGQAMVEGAINGFHFQTPLEPDGDWSHWFKLNEALLANAKVAAGDTVTMECKPMKDWPEPDVPADLKRALAAAPRAYALWERVTPMAHWEWIRWIRSTNRQETRQRRVEVAISKLEAGKRRPCCWNRNLSTEPSVSKNGVLLMPPN